MKKIRIPEQKREIPYGICMGHDIRFGCNTLFTACEWNSSFIIAEAGTIPKGRAEGNNLCRGLN